MSASRDGLSLAEETNLSCLRQRLQRDMNCLSDPDRSTRRRALGKLQKALFQEAKIPEPVLRGLLTRHLAERLVGMLEDPVEKCREMAGGMLLEFLEALDDVPGDTALLAQRVFAVAEARVGAIPLVEPAEEIRALLLRLCCAALAKKSARSFGYEVAGEACAVLSAALTDSFPEAKRECCTLLLKLAAVCPGGLRLRLGKVLRALIVNLGHQHSKTRQMTLQALGALMLCGSDDLDKTLKDLVLPQLRNLIYDRTLAVRRELAGILARLVEAGFAGNERCIGHSTDSTVQVEAPEADEGVVRASRLRPSGSEGERVTTAYLAPFQAEFLSLLMALLADEAEAVSDQAARLLVEVGKIWGKSNAAAVESKERSASGNSTKLSFLPPAATRALCSSLLPRMMAMAIEDAGHWTVRGRTRAVRLMCFLVRYVGDDVTPYLPQLLASLGEASRDDEVEVRQAVDECAAAVGRAVVELSAVTDLLLPVLRGEISGESTPQRLAQTLAVLRPVISAASVANPQSLAPLMGSVCGALCGRAVLEADSRSEESLWEEELEACRAVVESGFGDELRRPQIRLDILRALLWLLSGSEARGWREDRGRGRRKEKENHSNHSMKGGNEDDGDNIDYDYEGDNTAEGDVMEIASRLARENASVDAQDLFSEHFTDLLAYAVWGSSSSSGSSGGGTIEGDGKALQDVWSKGSGQRAGFEALLRSAPRAVGRHLGEVIPIFREVLHDASREAEVRLSMLALLECVVKQREVTEEALRPYVECLLREMVLPNAVWRVGPVAATVRKVAIAVLYTALRGDKIGVEAVYATAEQLLPVLKTNLEDREASTRQMTSLSLQMMFQMLPGALGEEPVRLMYPELLKRLDDSNDTVRRAACGTIAAFFRATAPQNVRGTVLNYSVEQLLIHLDDEDDALQSAVFAVLKVAASIDPEGVRKLAMASRPSHRTPAHCDRLIALTNESAD